MTKNTRVRFVNIRSVQNKKASLNEQLLRDEVDVCVVSEMNTKRCPKLKGYTSFSNLSDKKFHGVSIFVANELAGDTLRIHDLSKNEMVHIRLDNVTPALNIVGVYMDVELRDSKEDKIEKVEALKSIEEEIAARGEAFLMVGDLNRPSIVKEYDQMTPGTKMFADWIQEGRIVMLNDPRVPTRKDPATGAESVLDIGLASKNVVEFVKEFHVDTEKKETPFAVQKKGKKFTDHYAVTMTIAMPEKRKYKKVKNRPVINFANKEGWSKYKEISDRRSVEILEILEKEEDVNKIETKIEKVEREIQEEAFGIIWKKPYKKKKKKMSEKKVKELVSEEFKEMEELIEEGISGKDLNSKMYRMKTLITGPKIEKAEAAALEHPVTKEIIVNRDEIKNAVLEHNLRILKKNEAPEDAKRIIEEKKEKHEEIMNQVTDDWELGWSSFIEVVNKLGAKGKRLYWLLTKAGVNYKFAIFSYLKQIVKKEEIPERFLDTKLTMIWKKKGSPLDLNNMRFIHGKEYRARVLEAVVVENMKKKIIEETPNIQIGGMPGHSSAEHLLMLKTWMKFKEHRKENGIFSVFDLSKFFDKESLLDCVSELKKIGVNDKSYRLWFKMNENTRISVKTTVGETEKATIYDSIGQGSMGGALVSSMNIGRAVAEVDKDVECSWIGKMMIKSAIFQDDISKYSDTLQNVRVTAEKLDVALKNKLLSVNYSKSKNLILGSKKFRADTLREMEANPIMMGGEVLEHSSKEQYLGDIIDERGCADSITETIKKRIPALYHRCEEIAKIAEHPAMASLGESRSAFKMFEAMVIPALLFNAETWIGFNEKHEKLLQDFQDNFVRRVLQVPASTPKAILQYDSGMITMKWRVAEKKILFVNKLMMKGNQNLARWAVMEEGSLSGKRLMKGGITEEISSLCFVLGCDYPVTGPVSKEDVKMKIRRRVTYETKMKMLECKKVRDRVETENVLKMGEENSYMERMPLTKSRVMFRYRARCIRGVKYNTKSSHTNLSCRLCQGPSIENQEHLLTCEGTSFERRGLDLQREQDFVIFWLRVTTKLSRLQDKRLSPGYTCDGPSP